VRARVRKKGGEREKKKEKKCVHTQERERQSERARARGEENVRVKANECTHLVIADELQRRVMINMANFLLYKLKSTHDNRTER